MNQYNPNNVEELATRLDQMNVDPLPPPGIYYDNRRLESQDSTDSCGFPYDNRVNNQHRMSVEDDDENTRPLRGQSGRRQSDDGNILIVANLDPAVFSDRLMKAKFESLFRAHDEQVIVRYLKSFRRVRLDFSNSERAERARQELNNYKLGATTFKCFIAQIIRPNFDNHTRRDPDERVQRVHGPETDDEDDEFYTNDQQHPNNQGYVKKGFLNIPKLTRQYLISPPMSPPLDWKPKEESEPCIDVQLLAAIANLVPGQTHELHAGNESQPGIVVEVCEEPYFDTTSKLSCKNKIHKTAIPGTPRPEPADLGEQQMES